MTKKTGLLVLIISIAAICLSVFSLCKSAMQSKAPAKDIQYVIYLGTNDKDTYQPVYAPEEAKAKVDEVLSKHFEGFTIQDAIGGWTNESGKVDHEDTIVIYLSDTTAEKVHAAADDLIREFHQSAVLIQANETTTEFYGASVK